MGPGVPYLGREHVLAALHVRVNEVFRGRGGLVLLAGEPGIGKTRTAEEVARYAQQRGAQALWGCCSEEAGASAFWPWAQILRAGIRTDGQTLPLATLGPGAADMAQLLPELRTQVADRPGVLARESAQSRFRVFDSIARFFERLTTRGPVILVIEDLHGADPSSLRLLEFIAREACRMPLMLLGSYREAPQPQRHPLTEWLAEALRLPGSTRLTLTGLSLSETARFVELSAGVRPAPGLAAAIHERTEGNPLFIGEYMRLLRSQGEGALRSFPSTCTMAVPRTVQAVIERRLAPLSAGCRTVLGVAAVIGREFAVPVVLAVIGGTVGNTGTAVGAALDEAEAAGIVGPLPNSTRRYRFAHALLREALYERISTTRRAELHRLVGETLDGLPSTDDHLADLAHHFAQAARAPGDGVAHKAIAYARRAGDRAMAMLAYEEAVRWYQLALELLHHPGAGDEQQCCAVTVDLGVAQREACDLASSQTTLLRAAALATRLGLREHLGRAALHFGTKVVWGQAFALDHTLVQLLEAAIDMCARADSELHARLLARLAFALQFAPDQERRRQISREALEMARRLRDPLLIAEALHAWLYAQGPPDNLDERLASARELAQHAEQVHAIELAAIGYGWCYQLLLERSDWRAAQAAGAKCEHLLDQLRDPLHRWWQHNARAAWCIQEGRFAEADRLAQECLRLEQQVNAGLPLGSVMLTVALWCTQGRRDRLEILAATARAPVAPVPAVLHQCYVAYLACQLERVDDARTAFEALASAAFADVPHSWGWFLCMHHLTEVCVFLDDTPRSEQLATRLAPYATRTVTNGAKVYVAPVAHCLGMLEAMRARWDESARHFEHALAMSRGMPAPPALARTQYEYARMLLRRGHAGDAPRAQALIDEALATARALEMELLTERLQALKDQATVKSPAEAPDHPLQPSAVRYLPSANAAVFRHEGQFWTVAYAGATLRLKDSRGLGYLAQLLRHPGTEFLVLDLAQGPGIGPQLPGAACRIPDGLHLATSAGNPTSPLDARARAAYKCRLEDLREELGEAEANNDLGHCERCRAEMDMLLAQLHGALGRGGRERPVASAIERARSAVSKRIRAEIKRIRGMHPALGRHLAATVTTGYFCAYTPDRDVAVAWEL
jgi:predicted ATPase